MMYWVLSKKLMWRLLLDDVKFTPHSYQIQTLFINILKTLFFISWIWKLISCLVVREMKRKEGRKSKGREREEERIVHRRIALIQFLQKKGLLWKNNGTIWRIVLRKFLEHKLFSKLWVVRKVWNFTKKRKSMKYWWISQIVYSHFLIENWKVKMLGTITAHIDIEKLNERGKKKMLNAKLERHLARPHTLPYKVSTFIYTSLLPVQCTGYFFLLK